MVQVTSYSIIHRLGWQKHLQLCCCKGTTKIAHMQILEVFFEKIFFLDMQKKRPSRVVFLHIFTLFIVPALYAGCPLGFFVLCRLSVGVSLSL